MVRILRTVLLFIITSAIVMAGAEAAQAKSAFAVSISVNTAVTELGKSVVVSGAVSPNAKGKKVSVQRRIGTGAWKTVATPKLSSTSKYSAPIKMTAGGPTSFRVIKAKSSSRNAGTSATKAIAVFRWRYLSDLPYAPGGSGQPGNWTLNGNVFVNSISYSFSNSPKWNVAVPRCTKIRTHVGIDADSPNDTTGSIQLLMPINEYPFNVIVSQDDGLATVKNPRYVQANFPVGPAILVAAGSTTSSGGTPYLTLGSPVVYCNS